MAQKLISSTLPGKVVYSDSAFCSNQFRSMPSPYKLGRYPLNWVQKCH